ncbi:TetR/AcrR family transcriptional regulator [Kribbella sp. DT2]|uniref:TetR/AcrR family transcriptional regulator n=1 Tax=Kribbella sp. DT2 TaxID=3393427 RepID=UPI003CE9F942
MTKAPEGKLLKRPERRRALIKAAARAFARGGYAATNLDDVAAEAGVSRVLIYRHFESKTQLYEAVLADVSDQLRTATGHPDHATANSLQGLVAAAQDNPDGFRLFFRQSGQEPEFRRHANELRAAMKATAHPYLEQVIHDQARLRWAADLIPTIAVEAVIAWLDAGCPSPKTAPDTISSIIASAVSAIASTGEAG